MRISVIGGGLAGRTYSDAFREHSLVPMGAAIWSSTEREILDMPARFFARFFRNHGLLEPPEPFLVTLNGDAPLDPARTIARMPFRHSGFTRGSLAAQARHAQVSGADRIHYCGACRRNGFHEDGVVSGLAVAAALACAREEVPA